VSRRQCTTDIPLIPREVLFGNPDKAMPKVSHDGKQLAFLAPLAGVLNVWVALADEPQKARAVTRDTDRGIRIYFWAYTNQHILYLQDKGGDENWRVYAVDLATDETRDLTPFEKVAAQVQEVSKEHAEEILVGLNNRDARYHDVHRVNIRTGELTLLQENPDFLGFITDDDFNLRFAVRMTAEGGEEVFKPGRVGGNSRLPLLFEYVGNERDALGVAGVPASRTSARHDDVQAACSPSARPSPAWPLRCVPRKQHPPADVSLAIPSS